MTYNLFLQILYELIPLLFNFNFIFLLFITYFSFNIKFNVKVQYFNFFLFIFFIYQMIKSLKITSIYLVSSSQNEFFFMNFNNYFYNYSFFLNNNKILILLILFLFISFFSLFVCTIKNKFTNISNPNYIKYYVTFSLFFILLFYLISKNNVLSSTNLLNTIIILECFTILTIYITSKININTLNSLIIYFFYSVFGYIFFMISTAIYIYIYGTDLVNIIYSYYNILYFENYLPFQSIIQINYLMFFISFALKLYLFPFSNIIDKLYNSINIFEIIIISFLFNPIIYIIFIQLLNLIGWFNQNNLLNNYSTNVILIFISIITFTYSINIAIDKNNLRSLIAYSSINTSALFLMFIAMSNYIFIEWWTYFFSYQIIYLLILFIFVALMILPNKLNLTTYDFISITTNLIYKKLMYQILILLTISVTMMLPPLFFFKIDMIVSFLYLNFNFDLYAYNFIYLIIILIYSISSYILYIRIFVFFKLTNVYQKIDNITKKNIQIINYYKKK